MANTAHGNKTIVKQKNGDGTLTDLTSLRNGMNFEQTQETDPDLAFGERSDGHTIGLLEPGNLPLSGSYSAAYLRHCAGIWQSETTKTTTLDQAGTLTGRRHGSVEAILTSIELAMSIDGTSTLATDHKLSGPITWTANP